MYEKLKQAIQDQMYTVTEAVNLLNTFFADRADHSRTVQGAV